MVGVWEATLLRAGWFNLKTSKKKLFTSLSLTSQTTRHVVTRFTDVTHQIMIFIAQYNPAPNTSDAVVISFPGSTPG